MPHLRRSLPSLAALVAFEAAARHGGFTSAARELGVTQAAVSRQIRALEAELGTDLFVRLHRRVELTSAGSVLAMATNQSFERIGDAIDVIRQPAATETLTVAATLAFSHFWLLPRLSSFRAQHLGVKLRVLSQDAPIDLRDGGVDLAVRYGRPPFRDGEVVASMSDEVFPVCSPSLIALAGPDTRGDGIGALPRIESEAADASWLSWRRWSSLAGLGPVAAGAPLRFSHYSDAVYAAIDGQGVVLGWGRLLERALSDGRLVRVGRAAVSPEDTYGLVVPASPGPAPSRDAFIRWMRAEMT